MSSVQFSEPQKVVNAACCSNPKVMCERCAADSLAKSGATQQHQPSLLEELLGGPVSIRNATAPVTPLPMSEAWDEPRGDDKTETVANQGTTPAPQTVTPLPAPAGW